MKQSRRNFLFAAAGVCGSFVLGGTGATARTGPDALFTPEMFGAKGDGRTDDSAALAALAEAVNAAGGGVVRFRRTTYRVGSQRAAGRAGAFYVFEPGKLLEFRNCTRPLLLEGNGARLKCAPDLRYGVFEPNGDPARHVMPYIGPGLATPYAAMIRVERCLGPVEISNLELDGSLAALRIGGGYGDTGWQIPANGLALIENRGPETVRNLYSHHHALDGLYIDGADVPAAVPRKISDSRCEYNGRQGCSIVGGRGYGFERCDFSHTGRGGLASAPGAGVDIEAEAGKQVRDLTFTDCSFVNNVGCGMVADSGDSEKATFTRSTFVGTTNWSAWPCKPRFEFQNCVFAGALTRAFGDPDPARAAKFFGCTFTDDGSLSPTGGLYGGVNGDRPLADLSDAQNMLFSHCTFLALQSAVLPWSTGAIYENCRMEQRVQRSGYPRGTFLGRTIINGKVDLYGSNIRGELLLNGSRLEPTPG